MTLTLALILTRTDFLVPSHLTFGSFGHQSVVPFCTLNTYILCWLIYQLTSASLKLLPIWYVHILYYLCHYDNETTLTIEKVISEGAELYCERRGSGSLLLLITGGMGDAGFYSSAADILANEFTKCETNRENKDMVAAIGRDSDDAHYVQSTRVLTSRLHCKCIEFPGQHDVSFYMPQEFANSIRSTLERWNQGMTGKNSEQ